MRRSRRPAPPPVCTWCGDVIHPSLHPVTTPAFTRFPDLPTGTGVAVCSPECPQRPDGAPVGALTREDRTS